MKFGLTLWSNHSPASTGNTVRCPINGSRTDLTPASHLNIVMLHPKEPDKAKRD